MSFKMCPKTRLTVVSYKIILKNGLMLALWKCFNLLTSPAETQGRISSRGEPPCVVHCLVQKAVQRINLLNCYRKCITHLHYFPFFLIFFSQKVFPSEYVNLLQQELCFAYVFIEHKHREHLVSDKDTVAKQIKNMISKVQREVVCQRWHRPSEIRLSCSEVWLNTWTRKIFISLHGIMYQKLVFR